jgi:hypothetical protein
MTPLELTMALHYYYSTTDFRDGDFSAPAVRDAIEKFKKDNLITANSDNSKDSIYVATERLDVFVEKLCETPLPQLSWAYK